ncbi:Phox homologous domain-containing protein [Radiomyces spectabilis]|uniref:Phox homologous domain-containing protein n=1 Tax=Radiomyces spectabilis TaxID=64574 RepID=UPI00221F3C48|nr:Phox homologous domain-containing protein [Radiomyces spectabilis]KAI8379503.1 Phox homologous domain-containing protein [Radiomyces spectabilis]
MSEVIQAIFVRETETRLQPKPHTEYKVEVQAAVRHWHVWKRYTDFVKLNAQFQAIFPKHPLPVELPSKSFFTRTFDTPLKIDDRRRGLETYLRGILSSRDDRWRQTSLWKEFLAIPASRTADNSILYSSESWLDEYNDMTNTAREIRSLINRRATHIARNEISASHNCSVQAKKLLMTLSSRLSSLDAGLSGVASEDMSSGELRRRRDMLSNLKEERDGLMRLIQSGRQEQDLLYQSLPTGPAMRVNEMHGDKSVSMASAQRPLQGQPMPLATETEVTRGLDNEGLLQYQQQVMKEQDDQVAQFSAILARQKQLGLVIGDELDVQNQLLDELDGDVGRTHTKLKFANKKLEKIK